MIRVVVAPDSFKGTLGAAAVARHVAAGVRSARPDVDVDLAPLADGGEGTVDAAVAAGFERRTLMVSGPTGEPVSASFAVRGDQAVVELAEASGLGRLVGGRLDPLRASTFGAGQLLRAALDAGCRQVVLGVGGSATTDGGAGLLAALGARVVDRRGRPVPPGGEGLLAAAEADLTGLDPRLADARIVLASDVDNPLLGADGAAAVYGPQKGAAPHDVKRLEDGLRRWVDVLARATPRPGPTAAVAGAPGAGAAGGAGFAAVAVLGAFRRPGFDVVAGLLRLHERLAGAALAITGEGALDAQTVRGKVPVGVARAAAAAGVPAVAVCGRLALAPEDVGRAGLLAAYPLTDLEPDLEACRTRPGPLLEQLGRVVAQRHLTTRSGC